MFLNIINRKYFFSRISQSLRILELKQPVTQKQIKNKYRELAKKYHPDSLDQKASKHIQQKFVKITVAYNQLKDLDQTILNQEQYDIKIPEEDRERAKTQDEINRQKTYDYFNRRTVDPNYKPTTNPNNMPKKQKPLYKTVPQLFVGTAFVFFVLGEWLHQSTVQSQNTKQKAAKQHQNKSHQKVFKNFNYKKAYVLKQLDDPVQKSYDRN